MNRAARNIRNGSSLNDTSGDKGVRNVRVRQVDRAAERVDEGRCRRRHFQRHRIHREVATRKIGLDVIGELDVRFA